jgi:RNA ligase
MIHPAVVNDELVFMTRMGRTDVALKAEELLTPALACWCRDALGTGLTPIFEYTSPKQRIVIRYDDCKLTLLAIRHTVNGQYLDISGYKVPGVDCIARVSPEWLTARSFMDFVAAILGAEGFVVTFENGLWVKAKGMDYVLKHKSKEGIHLEKNALALIITGALDDVLPLLDVEDATAVQEYAASVHAGMKTASRLVADLVDSGSSLSQKEFAVDHLHGQPDWLKPLAFQVRAGKKASVVVADAVLKRCSAQSDVDRVRDIFRAEWRL